MKKSIQCTFYLFMLLITFNSCEKERLESEIVTNSSQQLKFIIKEGSGSLFVENNEKLIEKLSSIPTSQVELISSYKKGSKSTSRYNFYLDTTKVQLVDNGFLKSYSFPIVREWQDEGVLENYILTFYQDGTSTQWIAKYFYDQNHPNGFDMVKTEIVVANNSEFNVTTSKTNCEIGLTQYSYDDDAGECVYLNCTAGKNHTWSQRSDCNGDENTQPQKICTGGWVASSCLESSGGGTGDGSTGSSTGDPITFCSEDCPLVSPISPSLTGDSFVQCQNINGLGYIDSAGGCTITAGSPITIEHYATINEILNHLDLDFYQVLFLRTRADLVEEIRLSMEADFHSTEATTAAEITIDAFRLNKMGATTDDAALQEIYSHHIPNISINPALFAQYYFHFTVECAILREKNPNWPDYKIYYHASKEMVHITLDVFGLVPVVGEAADLINGVLYTIEGDGVNATLSFASAVPIAGWASAGVKYGLKIVDANRTVYSVGTKVKLVWKIGVDGVVYFGSSGAKLRKALGLAPYAIDARQAHHIIPWGKRTHPAIQKAAKSDSAFHINEALNGIPLDNLVHNGSHSNYDNLVLSYLDAIPANATVDETYVAVNSLVNRIRTAIVNNPGTHINNLIF